MTQEEFNEYLRCNWETTYVSGIPITIENAGFTPIRINSKKAPQDHAWNTNPPQLIYDPNQLYGMMPPPNIIIVDVDVKNGKQGTESFAKFVNDNYPPDYLNKIIHQPNVRTPSGGCHYYFSIQGLDCQHIPKIHPNYPGIDFITHGKSQAVAGNQRLDNGFYSLIHLNIFEPLKSLECFTLPMSRPAPVSSTHGLKTIQKTHFQNPTASEIQRLLEFIPPDEYDTWYKVGFMLASSDIPEEQSKQLFHEWSAHSDKYNEHDCERKWNTLRADYGKPGSFIPITMASLPYLAKTHSPDKVNEINEIYNPYRSLEGRFVLVQSFSGEQKYYDLKTRCRWIKECVEIELAPLLNKASDLLKLKRDPRLKDLVKLGWVLQANESAYSPTSPSPIFSNHNGKLYINTFDPDSMPLPMPFQPGDEDIDFFINHIRHIFGDYADDFINYIAYLSQNPGKKIRYMMVLQGGVGTGKGLIIQAIRRHVFGWENTRAVDTETFTGDYNSALFDKLLIIVEELKVPAKDARTTMNRIKTLITEPTAMKKEKYVVATELPCIASFIALTNHKDCLKYADTRRFHAIISPIQEADALEKLTGIPGVDYFKRLASIASEGSKVGGKLRSYFMLHQIPDDFSPDKRPERSDFEKIEKENLDHDDKWSDYIDLIRFVYKTDTLPHYIDCDKLIKRCTESNPDTDVPFFSPDEPLVPKLLKKFGRAFGYKMYFKCLYSDKLNEDEAKLYISSQRKYNQPI